MIKTLKRVAAATSVVLAVPLFMIVPIASAANTTIYNNIPSSNPGNVISQAFEATQTSEFGGQVQFDGTARNNPKVTILMSSWGCENGSWDLGTCSTTTGAIFTHPITLNIYEVGANDAPGNLLFTKTQPFDIPYRPSANNIDCAKGKWSYPSAPKVCFNGVATPISFDLQNFILPSKVIIGVAYNTTHYGYNPITESATCFHEDGGCGYDSLNVGAFTSLTVGTLPLMNDAYLNSLFSGGGDNGTYCINDQTTVGTFRLDKGCWGANQPSFKVEASSMVGPATTKEQCKNNGWMKFNNPTYKNQGDCVSAIASKGKAKGNPAMDLLRSIF